MVKAADLLFGKIVIRNQLAAEAAVRDCIQALAAEGGEATLADIMVRRGLLAPIDAEKARHAAVLAQAQRYLKFAAEMGLVAPASGQQAVDELRRRGYAGGIGRVLIDLGVLQPDAHLAIVARDPRTLDEGDRPALPPAMAAPPPPAPAPSPFYVPPAPPPAPVPKPPPPFSHPPAPPPHPPDRKPVAAPLPARAPEPALAVAVEDLPAAAPLPEAPEEATLVVAPPALHAGPPGPPPAPPGPPAPHAGPPGLPAPLTPPAPAPAPPAPAPAAPVPPPAIPAAPRGPAPVLRGAARELVAVALRDQVLVKAEVDAVLAAAPPPALDDARALGDALVAAGVLARAQIDLIDACVVLEREEPALEIEGFYLVAPLGFGRFGPVITARRTEGPRPGEPLDLSLEIMPPTLALDTRRMDEFRRRSGYLLSADHPALTRTVDTGTSGGCFFIARESPAGVTLAERVAKKPLPEKDALDLARALADALGTLALVQLLHGAVRPENVILTDEGRWILGYGGDAPAPAEWDPEMQPPCVGLPHYLSPEAIRGDPLGPRSDMYCLGLVLFAAVTGRPPYDGSTSAAIIAQHLAGPLPDPAAFGARVSPAFTGLVRALTALTPEQRYRDYPELLEDLERLRGEAGRGEGGEADDTLLYPGAGRPAPGGDESDRTMLGSADEDSDLKEMRRLAAERRARGAAAAAGLLPVDAATAPAPGPGGDPLIGQVLSGRYRMLKKLGAGGMGTVYLAEHLLLHKNVALKILHPKLLENEEAVQRFDREVKASSRFQHPGVVQIFDAGEDQAPNGTKLHYMVMEYVEGEDLHRITEREGALPLPRACNIMRLVLPAIDEAHKKGIVHRDMKSDNIMVCRGADGSELAKIMDFGIAKIIEGQEAAGGATGLHDQQQFKTRKGVVTGTPQYMSPEQASGDPNIDGRSDIYSFGVIVYEMCLGELPFRSNTAMGYLGKHIVEPPVPVKEARPDIDLGRDLERIIMRCLEKPREKRYQTAAEMLKDLEETVFPTVLGTAPPGGARRRGAGAKLVRAFLLLLLLAAAGAAGFAGWHWYQGYRIRARAFAITTAGDLVGKGDAAAAKAILDELGADGDPVVKAVRARIAVVEAEAARLAEQKKLLDEGDAALAGGRLALARDRYAEAQKIRSDDRVRLAFETLAAREREAEARELETEGDRQLALNELDMALSKYQRAAELAPRDGIERKIARASFKILLRDAESRRAHAEDEKAFETIRQALALLPPEDPDATETEGRLRELLVEYRKRLSPDRARDYYDQLLAAARARDAARDFREALRYYKDAKIFAAEAEAQTMGRNIQEADARATEQSSFETAVKLARRTLEDPTAGVHERTFAADALRDYIQRYGGTDEATGKLKGHFVEEAREVLDRFVAPQDGSAKSE